MSTSPSRPLGCSPFVPHSAFASAWLASLVAAAASLLAGCGGVYYTAQVQSASTRLEEARVLGAETAAPFEYFYARAHLEEAQYAASEASYQDAALYAEEAEQYAAKAVELARAARGAQ